MSRLLGLGARFPEFSLQACVSAEPGSEFRIVESRELAGTWSAIFFWPLDFTFVCPTELVEFNRALREFRALAARVFGVSGDSHHAHLAWRKENPALRNLEFPMQGHSSPRLAPPFAGAWNVPPFAEAESQRVAPELRDDDGAAWSAGSAAPAAG